LQILPKGGKENVGAKLGVGPEKKVKKVRAKTGWYEYTRPQLGPKVRGGGESEKGGPTRAKTRWFKGRIRCNNFWLGEGVLGKRGGAGLSWGGKRGFVYGWKLKFCRKRSAKKKRWGGQQPLTHQRKLFHPKCVVFHKCVEPTRLGGWGGGGGGGTKPLTPIGN